MKQFNIYKSTMKYLRCPYCHQKNWIQENLKGKIAK